MLRRHTDDTVGCPSRFGDLLVQVILCRPHHIPACCYCKYAHSKAAYLLRVLWNTQNCRPNVMSQNRRNVNPRFFNYFLSCGRIVFQEFSEDTNSFALVINVCLSNLRWCEKKCLDDMQGWLPGEEVDHRSRRLQ